MKTFTKANAIAKAVSSAVDYDRYLKDNKFLIIFRKKDTTIQCFEIRFPDYAFMHLTGLKIDDESILHSSKDFFDACCKKKISPNDIKDPDGTDAERKLAILPTLINFIHYSKMTLIFNNGRPVLRCDRVVGTTNYCLALNITKAGYYVPVSCLNEDIRDFGKDISQIVAIFQADLRETVYSNIRNVAKGVNLKNLNIPTQYMDMIDLSNYREPLNKKK